MNTTIRTEIIESLANVNARDWNALNRQHNPFLSHEFLIGLERHQAVGQRYGWYPHHVLARDETGEIIGAAPMYTKDNSYGELVFDHSWAHAYQRSGLRYYPKLVIAVPYTPATGERLLTRDGDPAVRKALIEAAKQYCNEHGYSSLHCLFATEAQITEMQQSEMPERLDVQYHWFNRGYRNFADFLDTFTASKRKKLKRERRAVHEAGIELVTLHGNELSEADWADVHHFYRSTFDRKYGYATFEHSLFLEWVENMGRNMVIVLAKRNGRNIATAINFRGEDTLYGRHWGCIEPHNGLHFEACYYQGLEYAIENQLKVFEPGAQGEHKIARGFEPVLTRSAHWIEQPDFRLAISEFLKNERRVIKDYQEELMDHLPYRTE